MKNKDRYILRHSSILSLSVLLLVFHFNQVAVMKSILLILESSISNGVYKDSFSTERFYILLALPFSLFLYELPDLVKRGGIFFVRFVWPSVVFIISLLLSVYILLTTPRGWEVYYVLALLFIGLLVALYTSYGDRVYYFGWQKVSYTSLGITAFILLEITPYIFQYFYYTFFMKDYVIRHVDYFFEFRVLDAFFIYSIDMGIVHILLFASISISVIAFIYFSGLVAFTKHENNEIVFVNKISKISDKPPAKKSFLFFATALAVIYAVSSYFINVNESKLSSATYIFTKHLEFYNVDCSGEREKALTLLSSVLKDYEDLERYEYYDPSRNLNYVYAISYARMGVLYLELGSEDKAKEYFSKISKVIDPYTEKPFSIDKALRIVSTYKKYCSVDFKEKYPEVYALIKKHSTK